MTVHADPESPIRAALTWQNVLIKAPWYAVVDAAQDRTLPRRASSSAARTASLFAGRLGRMLDDAAPHLATLDLGGALAAELVDRWDENLAILLQSNASVEHLRKHLRCFLMIKDEAGKKYRFRYYDPRILRAFLPACTATEARSFFGPVKRYYAASRFGAAVLGYSLGPDGVRVTELSPD